MGLGTYFKQKPQDIVKGVRSTGKYGEMKSKVEGFTKSCSCYSVRKGAPVLGLLMTAVSTAQIIC